MKKYRLIFFGTPPFALPSLKLLGEDHRYQIVAVVTQSDKARGRGLRARSSPVKLMAKSLGLKILEPEKIRKNPGFLEELRKLEPDLIVVVAYGKILPTEVLNAPKFGALNIHASFLPRHRGASPIQGAILSGDKETGVTLMKMVLKMDAGPILAQSRPIKIEEDDTAETLAEKLAPVGARLLIDNLPGFFAGLLPQTPQAEALATYTKIIEKESARLDWQKTASELAREIRAYLPWPVSWTTWPSAKGLKAIKFFRAKVKEGETTLKPGEVAWQEKALLIGTAQGALEIQELQLEGKKRLPSEEFVRGQKGFIRTNLI